MEEIKDFRKVVSYKILIPQVSDGSLMFISWELPSVEFPSCESRFFSNAQMQKHNPLPKGEDYAEISVA